MLLLGCRSEVKALTILKRCAKGNLSLTGNLFIGMGKTNLETFEGLFFCVVVAEYYTLLTSIYHFIAIYTAP